MLLTREKMVVLIPMTSAIRVAAVALRPGDLVRMRTEPQVLQELFETHPRPHRAGVFLHERHVAELPQRLVAGLLRRHPIALVQLDLSFDVIAQLLVKIAVTIGPSPHDVTLHTVTE